MGKHPMKIYVINKPIKCKFIANSNIIIFLVGFRAFVLCESSSGYVIRWFLDKS